MIIKPINHITAISFKEEIYTSGNSPIKVIGNDYEMYLVKNSKNKNPATDIINEVLAYYFLSLWKIPIPKIAVTKIDTSQLLPEYSRNHKPIYYEKEVFASHWLSNTLDINELFEIKNKRDYDKYYNPEVIFEIGLFDIWVENDDRKPTNQNLILHKHNGLQHIVPIDHAFIFGSNDYLELNPDYFAGSDNDNIFISNLAKSLLKYKKKSKAWAKIDREKFYLCIQKCKENYVNIVKNIPESWGFTQIHQNKLYEFLFNESRNKAVFEEYLYKLS